MKDLKEFAEFSISDDEKKNVIGGFPWIDWCGFYDGCMYNAHLDGDYSLASSCFQAAISYGCYAQQ